MVVKAAFNQRRKTLHNSLKGLQINWEALPEDFPKRRPEQIKLEEFYLLAQQAGLGEQ
jgi:16S rRNA A1518/A1519 N6-dimethyltransferase RsmA/KsgA/DIM1 with predicted DNA glycosylase/AP lyase activity